MNFLLHISVLLSGLMVHNVVFDHLCVNTIVPIPKGNNTNRAVFSNYRAIALSLVIGKIFDRIVLNKYCDKLATFRLQFGFKKKTFYCFVYICIARDYRLR